MKENCVNHIKQKINDSASYEGEIDDVVEQIMMTTFSYLNENQLRCCYCQNRSRLSVFSMCRVNHHLQPECTDNSLDIKKFLKNNCNEIMLKANNALCDLDIADKCKLTADFKKQIICESVELFESIDLKNFKSC